MILEGQSRRSFVKADDLKGSKQTILGPMKTTFGPNQTIKDESGRSYLIFETKNAPLPKIHPN